MITCRKVLTLAALVAAAACSESPVGPGGALAPGDPFQAISSGGAGTAAHANTSSLSVTAPAALSGDLLIAHIVARNPGTGSSQTNVCAPSGWTQVQDQVQSGGNNHRQAIFYRKVTSDENSTAYPFAIRSSTCDGSAQTKDVSGGISRYSGVDISGDPVFGVANANGNGLTATAPSVADAPEGSFVLRLVSSAGVVSEITPSSTPPRIYYEAGGSDGDTWRRMAGFGATQATTSATGTFVATVHTGNARWIAHTVVLKEAAAVSKTETVISDVSGSGVYAGDATLTATLFDDDDNALEGKTVKFYVDEAYVGSADTDEDGLAEYEWVDHGLDAGTHDMKAVFEGDDDYETSSEDGTLTIDKAATESLYDGQSPDPVQYSDEVTLNASADVDGEVQFQIWLEEAWADLGDAITLDGDLKAEYTFTVFYAPGDYKIQVVFTPADENNYEGDTSEEGTLTVSEEDADITYTGLNFVSTASVTSSEFNARLSATIVDADDDFPGDIRNARVTFKNGGAFGTPISGCTNLVPQLVDPADETTGTVGCEWSSSIGNNPSMDYDIFVEVGGYYTGDDQVSLVVSKGAQNSIAGGGYFINEGSAGQYAADDDLRTNFGFTVKFNAAGRRLQGRVNVIIRTATHTYQIKSNAIDNLTADPDKITAVFQSKANLTDITDPYNPIALGGNLNIQMEIEDGDPDKISITLRTSNGQLLYSSNWNGVQTVDTALAGGNLQIR